MKSINFCRLRLFFLFWEVYANVGPSPPSSHGALYQKYAEQCACILQRVVDTLEHVSWDSPRSSIKNVRLCKLFRKLVRDGKWNLELCATFSLERNIDMENADQ